MVRGEVTVVVPMVPLTGRGNASSFTTFHNDPSDITTCKPLSVATITDGVISEKLAL